MIQSLEKSDTFQSVQTNFIIFLPALSEQSIVEETITYFNKFVYPNSNLKIVTITTEREKFERTKNKGKLQNFYNKNLDSNNILKLNDGLFPNYLLKEILEQKKILPNDRFILYINNLYNEFPTTQEKINNYLNKHSRYLKFEFLNIHYPFEIGNKSSQLNYALDYIPHDDITFIAVYDFDAKPDLRTLLEIDKLRTNKPQNKVFQQIPLPLLQKSDNKNLENLVIQVYHLMQCRRNIGIEYWMHNNSNEYLTPLKYCMGSGLFIEADLIKKIKYSEPVDDIQLGYKLNYMGVKTAPISSLNLVYMVDKLKDLKGQSVNINYGMIVGIFKEKKMLREANALSMPRFLILIKIINSLFTMLIIPITSVLIFLFSLYCLIIDIELFLKLQIILVCGYGFSSIIIWTSVIPLYKIYKGVNSDFLNSGYNKGLFFIAHFRGLIRAFLRFRAILIISKKIIKKQQFITTKTHR